MSVSERLSYSVTRLMSSDLKPTVGRVPQPSSRMRPASRATNWATCSVSARGTRSVSAGGSSEIVTASQILAHPGRGLRTGQQILGRLRDAGIDVLSIDGREAQLFAEVSLRAVRDEVELPHPLRPRPIGRRIDEDEAQALDRKSTRLNSSHTVISYAVFCLKKKNQTASWHLQTNTLPTMTEPSEIRPPLR